jgi:hypothetical protein
MRLITLKSRSCSQRSEAIKASIVAKSTRFSSFSEFESGVVECGYNTFSASEGEIEELLWERNPSAAWVLEVVGFARCQVEGDALSVVELQLHRAPACEWGRRGVVGRVHWLPAAARVGQDGNLSIR